MIDIERRGEVAVLAMRAGKGNALGFALLQAIERALDDVRDAGAVVLTGDKRAFCAGLALPELIDLDRTRMTELVDVFEHAMRRVLEHPRATVAAINGFAIAGGCVLALACDARVMAAGDAQIGLNEVQLGIGLPAVVIELLRLRVAPGAIHAIALEGRLFAPEAARAIGLVDDVVEPAALLPRALAIAEPLARNPLAYTHVKRALIASAIDTLDRRRVAEREGWLDTWFSAPAQRTLRAAVERLAKR